MRITILFLFLIAALSTQVKAGTTDDMEILELETPGCGNGGSNYLREVTSYDPLDVLPDLTMEPSTSIKAASSDSRQNASRNANPDLLCIDSFEREANDTR